LFPEVGRGVDFRGGRVYKFGAATPTKDIHMNRILLSFAVFLMASQHVCATNDAPGGLKLLEGYSMKRGSAVDADAWTIEKQAGLKISFEAGPSEGSWADPNERDKYSWYREQKVNGYKARFALIKHGLKTQWEPDDSRGLPPGNILLVTFLLDGDRSSYTANFSAKVSNSREMGDALLMVMTFDPSKGTF
jgi:hypothetical protein